jgi:amidase
VFLGQTNMPDFAASDTNYSTAFGRTGNAYNPRYSPGGSSGGTVTAVTANLCLMGTGTDTANSIRMPAATSSVVGVLPTRGLVSIAGIQPLDWLRDNTGPIARDVRDTAIALTVMAGEDTKDFRTKGSAALAESGPYTKYLNAGALAGKRFGVPAFMMTPAAPGGGGGGTPLQPETRDMFMKAIEGLKAAGATVVFDDGILDSSFTALTRAMSTRAYTGEGTENFLRDFGPPEYHSSAEYAQVMGVPLSGTATGAGGGGGGRGAAPAAGGRAGAAPAPAPAASAVPKLVETDPDAETNLWAPQRAAVAAYDATLDKFKLDGLVYPAIQMPPNDELSGLPEQRSSGPHSNTGWVNNIGVPAISMPAGFYENGLPFGLEFSAKRWHDGDLLGWVYSYEQATKLRKPPVLIENTKRRPTG